MTFQGVVKRFSLRTYTPTPLPPHKVALGQCVLLINASETDLFILSTAGSEAHERPKTQIICNKKQISIFRANQVDALQWGGYWNLLAYWQLLDNQYPLSIGK
jgi:hypothetical protein